LRGDSEDFHIHGHHKNLSQVELLQWLPLDVVVEVMAAFENILLCEIIIMQHCSKHTPSHYHDNQGGRVSPDSSDGEDDTGVHQTSKKDDVEFTIMHLQ